MLSANSTVIANEIQTEDNTGVVADINTNVALNITSNTALNISLENTENDELTNEAEKSASKSKLLNLLNSFKTLTANFNQSVKDEDNTLLQQGNGSFSLSKPNLLHWSTLAPDESTIVSDGESLWLYDPFIEQATVYSLENSINNTPILLLMNQDEKVWSQYTIEEIAKESNNTTTIDKFNITSKDSESQVQSLSLIFDGQVLSSFTINDITGQKSEFLLTDIETDKSLSPSLFLFEVPDGSVIDDQR